MTLKKNVLCDDGGWYAEVYTDDDNGSGYGDHPRVGRWYGTRQECEAISPRKVTLHSVGLDTSPDPFDLACEHRHD
jgi:hypothetical protein